MKYKHLFGPVPSRRLGISLGIDLIPAKVCSQNCIYCEVGKTTNLTIERQEYISLDSIIEELEIFLKSEPELDYITFSGSGEPVLNSRLGELVSYLRSHYPQYKIACITNSTLIWDQSVQNELRDIDVLLPSLDAASEKAFQQLNRPHHSLHAAQIIEGLTSFRKIFKGAIWLEIFFSPGINDQPEELRLLRDACEKIKADRIQLNTLDRPGVIKGLSPLPLKQLEKIVEYFKPLPVEIIAKASLRQQQKSFDHDINSSIIELIRRRPCTDHDLCQILGLHINELNKYLASLLSANKIREIEGERGIFFELKK